MVELLKSCPGCEEHTDWMLCEGAMEGLEQWESVDSFPAKNSIGAVLCVIGVDGTTVHSWGVWNRHILLHNDRSPM